MKKGFWGSGNAHASHYGHQARRFISVDLDNCTGCRACELACSWHHAREFNPEISSINVQRDDTNGEIQVTLLSTCDHCLSEDYPLCVKFCAPQALKQLITAEHSNYSLPARG